MSQSAIELQVNGLTLRGMLHRPAGAGPHPAAVLFHGFTGDKVESHFIFVKLSRVLAQAGLAVVRFDFSGSGESDGEFADMTFGGEVAEAKAVLDYTRALPFVDSNRVGLVGLSMGGAVASVTAGDCPDKVRALVLWAPAANMREIVEARWTPEAQAMLDRFGRVDNNGHWLGRAFLDEVGGLDIYGRAAAYNGPVLLVHGEADPAVPAVVSHRYKEIYGDRAELRIIAEANHTFARVDWEEEAIKRTAGFLNKVLSS